MNVRINLPAELEAKLRRDAEMSGLDVETLILEAVKSQYFEEEPSREKTRRDFRTWLKHFRRNTRPMRNEMDDSRESMYEGRGE